MTQNDLILLRRKETVGTVAAAAWGLGLLMTLVSPFRQFEEWGILAIVIGWIFAAYWVALDTRYRDLPAFWWTVFTLAACPLALLFYFVSRPPAPAFCAVCGASLLGPAQVCPVCGQQTSPINRVFSALTESLAPGPLEKARDTAKYMALALGVFVILGMLFGRAVRLPDILGVLAVSAYWVLVPWWVYLDATWRKMDAVPWALLTLLTNVFGLVTYLVIRYPDPRPCPQCGSYLTPGLKRCPYCGSEAEPTCSQCQSPVKADWVYCPACASQLPSAQAVGPAETGAEPSPAPLLSVSGTVADARTRVPMPGAEVRIDSKTDAKATTTDPVGRFVLADLEPRPYVLLASADGYTQEAKAYTPSPGWPAQVHFALYPAEQGPREPAESEDNTAAEAPGE